MAIAYLWRGDFADDEVNALHAAAFGARDPRVAPMQWRQRLATLSLGWVVAREGDELVGFVNVPWDGAAHAWLQDTMVAASNRLAGVGTALVAIATAAARSAGCEWLHVDFDPALRTFYIDACGFRSTDAGLIELQA